MSHQHLVHMNKYFLVSNIFILYLLSLASVEGTIQNVTAPNKTPLGGPLSGQYALPKTEEKVISTETEKPKSPNETAKPDEEATKSATGGGKVCTAPYCAKVAKMIEESINGSVNPCTDFYEYACGSWIKKNKVPKHHTQFSRITQLSNDNEETILSALKSDQSTDSETVMKAKNFYRSCMDETIIDNLGKRPLLDYIKSLGSWALNDSWTAPKWEFSQVLKHIQRNYAVELFFTLDTIPDPVENRKKYILLIDQAGLNLPQIIYFTSPKIIRTVWSYMWKIVKETGVDKKEAKAAMKDLLKLEMKMALISIPKIAKKYVRIPLNKLAKVIPEFPWVDHLKNVLAPTPIKPTDKVVVLANNYLPDLIELLRKEKKSTLANYMVWRAIKDLVPLLSENFRHIHMTYKKKLLGSKKNRPRWKQCFGYTNSILGPLVGALFVRNAFSEQERSKVEVMMKGIIEAFKERVEEVGWIDKQTVQAVKEKADAAQYKVGFPDYLWDETTFYSRYQQLQICPGQWFENVLNTDRFANHQTFRKLGKGVDKHQWITVPQLVNAFYVITKNEVVIPAGILQPPFFYSHQIPRSISYGAIGHVLGHELTHGFDTTGRKFDKDGEVIEKRTKWSKPAIKMFEEKAKCLVEQFSRYKVLGKFHIDGLQTLGENIADGGGVKLAFRAYRNFIKENGMEEVLPKLNMTSEELFFIGYAQKECTHTTPLAEYLSVKEDVHALTKYRVIGTLSNFKEFSEVYKCPIDAPMNPKKKCEVW